jgi:hypothetical protein
VQTRFTAAALRALGAVGVPMPSAQLPLAIAQHMVEGCVDPWDMVPTFKLNDLLKSHTEFADLSLSTTSFVLAMSKASYDKLPRDLKTVIDNNSGQPAAAVAGAMWDVQASAVIDMVSGRGDPITTLLPEAVAHWRKATEPVIEAWLKDMKEHKVDGGKLLANIRTLLAKYASEPEPQPAQPSQPAEAKADATTPPKAEATSSPPTPSTPTPPKPAAKPAASATAPAPAPAPPTPSPAPAVKPAAPVAQPAPATASVTPAPSPAPAAPPVATPAPPPPPAPVASPPPAAPPPPVATAPVPLRPPPPKTLDIPL